MKQAAHDREQDIPDHLLGLDQDRFREICSIALEIERIIPRQVQPHHVQGEHVQYGEAESIDGIDVEGPHHHARPDDKDGDQAEQDGKVGSALHARDRLEEAQIGV